MNEMEKHIRKIKKHIMQVIGENIPLFIREYLKYIFSGDNTKDPTWGSLARGTLIYILSGASKNSLDLATSIELIHHGSLIVDDQIDKAIVRRGNRAFWINYSSEENILISHYIVNLSLIKLAELREINYCYRECINYALKAINKMAEAEIESQKIPINSFESYFQRVRKKTGSLYKLVAELASSSPETIISDKEGAICSLENIGISRQMLDDFEDANMSVENNVFLNKNAEIENRNRSIYKLQEYGFGLNNLKEYHKELSIENINKFKISLKQTAFDEAIIGMLYKICFGKNAVDLVNKERSLI